MKVLVACEFSGIVRDAFLHRGHDAISCDLLPTEKEGPHYQGDVRDLIYSQHFDLMIAHPPCTYLTNSGIRFLFEPDQDKHPLKGAPRWEALREGAQFFNDLYNAPINLVAVENPIPSRYAKQYIISNYTQRIDPWRFGEDNTKSVCLWLKNLPPLSQSDTQINEYGSTKHFTHLRAGENRWKERSRFFPRIAAAMAQQWGQLDV